MKQINFLESKSQSAPLRKMINALPVFLLLVSLVLITTGTVHAAAVFGSYTGPVWLNPGYGFTVTLATLSSPHQYIGLLYTVDGGAAVCADCSCTSPDCDPETGTGTWVCAIPSTYNNATIVWEMSAYPNVQCSGNKVTGPTGSFSTGPTAIKGYALTAGAAESHIVHIGLTALVVVGAVVFVLERVWKYKRLGGRSSESEE